MNPPSHRNPQKGQQSHTSPPQSTGSAAGPQEHAYFGETPNYEEGGDNQALKLGIVALVIIGAIAVSLALIFRSVDKAQNAPTPAGVSSPLAEHNQLMREAMQMAREAQELNRQHMQEMRRAMYEADGYAEYGGEYPGSEYPGSEEYVPDP